MNFNNLFTSLKYEPKLAELNFDLRDPDKVTNNILLFLQEQSKIAERNFKTSRNLIFTTIIIMILQVGYAVWSNIENRSIQKDQIRLIGIQLQQSEAISRMSMKLLDLDNQVQTLTQEKSELLKGLNSE